MEDEEPPRNKSTCACWEDLSGNKESRAIAGCVHEYCESVKRTMRPAVDAVLMQCLERQPISVLSSACSPEPEAWSRDFRQQESVPTPKHIWIWSKGVWTCLGGWEYLRRTK